MPKMKELLADSSLKRECLEYVALPGMNMCSDYIPSCAHVDTVVSPTLE